MLGSCFIFYKVHLKEFFSKIHIKRKSYNLLKAFYLFVLILGYLQESNAAVHSVDSDIFYAMIHVPGCFQDFFIS